MCLHFIRKKTTFLRFVQEQAKCSVVFLTGVDDDRDRTCLNVNKQRDNRWGLKLRSEKFMDICIAFSNPRDGDEQL